MRYDCVQLKHWLHSMSRELTKLVVTQSAQVVNVIGRLADPDGRRCTHHLVNSILLQVVNNHDSHATTYVQYLTSTYNMRLGLINPIHPIAPVWSQRIPISLWDFYIEVFNTRRYTLVHGFCFFKLFLMVGKGLIKGIYMGVLILGIIQQYMVSAALSTFF